MGSPSRTSSIMHREASTTTEEVVEVAEVDPTIMHAAQAEATILTSTFHECRVVASNR